MSHLLSTIKDGYLLRSFLRVITVVEMTLIEFIYALGCIMYSVVSKLKVKIVPF